ncbi:hypothetical protein [Viscerimonas tarda]
MCANLSWSLNDGTLTISGTGVMTDYELEYAPWYSYRADITTIDIQDGVTQLDMALFRVVRLC